MSSLTKAASNMVKAIEPAVRFYERPPAKPMTVETPWSDIWLSADDWAEAFEAPEPGTPHNQARGQIWDELIAILMDKHDGDAPEHQLRRSLMQNEDAAHDLQPGVAAARGGRPGRRPVVGTRLPAQVRSVAQPGGGPAVAAPGPPGVDGVRPAAAGRGAGSGSATRRRHDVSASAKRPSPPNASR